MKILDYDEVNPLQVLHLTMLALDFPLTPEHAAHIRQTDPRPSPSFTVNAVEDDRVLGQVGVFRLPMISTEGREEVGGVWAVSTHPKHTGRGIASALLDEAHTRMRESGLRFSTLGTGRDGAAYALARRLDKSVRVWDLSGRQLFTFQPDGPEDGFPSEVTGPGISLDGSRLVTIPIEGWIKMWDTTDFHKIQEFQGPIFGAYNGAQAAFSPDGRYLAVGLAAGTGDVSLWQVADGKLLWRGGFMAFAFSPDSQFFAHTEILPGDVLTEQVVISSADGQNIVQLVAKPFQGVVATMVFSPDSKPLALTIGDSEIHIWRLENAQLLATYQASCP